MSYEDPQDAAFRRLEILRLRCCSLLHDQITHLCTSINDLLTSNDFTSDHRYQEVLFSCITLQYDCRLLQKEHRELTDWLSEELRLPEESDDLFQTNDNLERLLELVLITADRFFVVMYSPTFSFEELQSRRAPLITVHDALQEIAQTLSS